MAEEPSQPFEQAVSDALDPDMAATRVVQATIGRFKQAICCRCDGSGRVPKLSSRPEYGETDECPRCHGTRIEPGSQGYVWICRRGVDPGDDVDHADHSNTYADHVPCGWYLPIERVSHTLGERVEEHLVGHDSNT